MSDQSFRLRLEMLSDWRIGTGTGRQGSVDGIVARDVRDLPFVPSTTLRGIWRDAAETLAHGLDGGAAGGGWARAVDHLFGSQPALDGGAGRETGPIPGLLTVGDARFPDELGRLLEPRPKARQAFTFIKSGVAIDPETGRAKDDFLRFDEIARADAVLACEVSIAETGDEDVDNKLKAFALASLRLVERLGGDRRRGAGRCRIEVVEKGKAGDDLVEEAVNRLAADHEAPVDVAVPTQDRIVHYGDAAGIGETLRFGLDVELTAPTTIASKVEGNLTSTLDFVPGTFLLSAAARLLAGVGVAEDDFFAAVSAGRARVLAATPLADGNRALPVPFILEEKKDDASSPWPGGARGSLRVRPQADDGGAQYRPLRSGYCLAEATPGKGVRFAARPETGLRTHNAVDDAKQKPTEDAGGGVYVQEAMKPGTRLRGAIVIDGSLLPASAAGKLVGQKAFARLGRARMTGYGAATVTVVGADPGPQPVASNSADGRLRLLVASDLVLPVGAPSQPLEALCDLLVEAGVEARMLPGESEVRFRRLDGWIGAWGLPRPSLTAVAAGSVIVLAGADDVPAMVLERLAVTGLGERRGEGYGEICIAPGILTGQALNPPPQTVGECRGASGETSPQANERHRAENAELRDTAKQNHLESFLEIVERAAVLDVLRTFAELAAADESIRGGMLGWKAGREPSPPMSQLGTLRGLIDAAGDRPNFSAACEFLRKIAAADHRARKWGGKATIGVLHDLLSSGDEKTTRIGDELVSIWEILERHRKQAFDEALLPATIVSTAEEVRAQWAAKATAEFLFAAIRQHKRSGEGADDVAASSVPVEA